MHELTPELPIASAVEESASQRRLPDVAHEESPAVPGHLDRVGMSNVEVVVPIDSSAGRLLVPGRADAFVDLVDPEAKGIHMSRLYLLLQEGLDRDGLTPASNAETLNSFVASHATSSTQAALSVRFDHSLRRESLVSGWSGWRTYPVRIASRRQDGTIRHWLSVRVTYSSTCPCSAALSRQLVQEAFDADFGGRTTIPMQSVRDWLGTEEALAGLPHAQRSYAEVTVALAESVAEFEFVELIDTIESSVETAVQSAVKRSDEQEFARLNAANLMFCEDAARRIRGCIEGLDEVADFRIRVRHLESLHPHDAVAVVVKGVAGGLTPDEGWSTEGER